MKVNILGTEYTVFTDDANDPELKGKDRAGYCFYDAREIHIADPDTDDDWKNEPEKAKKNCINRVLRHEIIHAFFMESGLAYDTVDVEAWAVNEEMVDWIAIQFPKLQKAFEEVGCL
ncbi:MAG: hypothetical protein H2212_07270 [Ruminococcus sp.]|nr:hypothetical protein [Ruminococcus sp.]